MNKKVSIVIPVYNLAKYVSFTIQNCLNPTYKNMEIIVVDDCSTDKTFEIVSGIKDDRIKIIKNDKNSGVAYSRNKGISISTGEYISTLDGDDYWSLNKIESGIKKLNGECMMIYNPRIDLVSNKEIKPNIKYYSGNVFRKLLKSNFITTSSIIYDRKLYNMIGGYENDRVYQGYEDYIFNLRASSVTKILLDDNSVTYFRIHPNQTTLTNKGNRDTAIKTMVYLNEMDNSNRIYIKIIYLATIFVFITKNIIKKII